MRLEELTSYTIVKKETISELKSEAYILKHNKTGARVALLSNDDENKVFYIGFRTPPEDSTGVMHILEHSVLCGSRNFPVKDPFIELAKGSLNTFLNAMTYPDKTVYPVASCNDKDFRNLMNVYLDAVFYPNILNSDKTFRQEGWHYELGSADDDLTVNGVVYNEMKGVFSSPDDVLEREIFNSLFPDNAYGYESGGDPDVIPELTYEHYLETYKAYYHPSNSYIYLYGNMDMAETLDFIDSEYLSDFDRLDIDSGIRSQAPFEAMKTVNKKYSVSEGEPLKDNSYMSLSAAFNNNLDQDKYIAFQVIDYALVSGQGAVLKKALLDAEIGKDIYSIYENGIKQPYFSVVAKNTEIDKKDRFLSVIEDTLREVIKNGFDRDTLRAGLNGLEFRYREADFGSYPPGLMYGLQVLDSWLYDDELPFIHIAADKTFKRLRDAIDTDYYERLVEKWLLNNHHKSLVCVEPEVGLVNKKEEALAHKLAEYKNSLTESQISELIKDTEELIAYQEETDDPEALKCIPMLARDDIKKEAVRLHYEVDEENGVKTVRHKIVAPGIDYIRVIFDTNNLDGELFKYLGIFKEMFGMVDTVNYSYRDLANTIFIKTGGLTLTNCYYQREDEDSYKITLDVKAKCLKGSLKDTFELIREVLFNSKYDDEKRIRELLSELKSHIQSNMLQASHSVATKRILSYHSPLGKASEVIGGMDMYRFLEELEADYDNRKNEFADKLRAIQKSVFVKDNIMFDFCGDDSEYEEFRKEVRAFYDSLPEADKNVKPYIPVPEKLNEGFKCASQVQFVGRGGDFMKAGYDYTGVLRVLRVILGYDYLWNNVRVKGGAYGCMSLFSKNGNCHFVSYRDPNLAETNEIFKAIPAYLKSFDADERTMMKYIIGAVSELDLPFTPSSRILFELNSYLSGRKEEGYQKERDEVLGVDRDKIRETADMIEAVLDEDYICVVGNSERIDEAKDMFDNVVNLINA
ncbi:MAG: insulinase family protein [Lachnospiraceae bacterium]|nr:insulinase family protein [Lachnospiraceae bacterium]